ILGATMESVILWLKTSPPGIIILGALGSLVAAGVIDIIAKRIPRAFGARKSYFLSHNQVFDRIFAKRQQNLLLTYFMHHLMYAVIGVLIGVIMAFWAFWFMYDGGKIIFSGTGIGLLTGGFYFLAIGFYKAYFIKRAYREKFLILLRDDNRSAMPESIHKPG
ncbi:hypothetical protein, partial [Ectothiorhodospira variabilis]|uniref:hypothetical protein n=1 Tax=Ectothiorhodospira variabilis TaxID=505694 RepID=UPI001EFB97B8